MEISDLALCEAERIIPNPDRVYRFSVIDDCKRCLELDTAANKDVSDEVAERHICEAAFLALRPNQKYRFSVDEECIACTTLAQRLRS